MKIANVAAMAGVMVWVAGCASASKVVVVEPVGPGPAQQAAGHGSGSLAIYSAPIRAVVEVNQEEWRFNDDFGKNAFLYEPAHTSYTIYNQSGELVRQVRNARDQNDGTPTLVSLPPGTYRVEAKALDCSANRVQVAMTIVIKPGETTVAHLDGGWRPMGEYGNQAELVRLPCGRPIGWRASERGYASARSGS